MEALQLQLLVNTFNIDKMAAISQRTFSIERSTFEDAFILNLFSLNIVLNDQTASRAALIT